jgi:hypothetical protein
VNFGWGKLTIRSVMHNATDPNEIATSHSLRSSLSCDRDVTRSSSLLYFRVFDAGMLTLKCCPYLSSAQSWRPRIAIVLERNLFSRQAISGLLGRAVAASHAQLVRHRYLTYLGGTLR